MNTFATSTMCRTLSSTLSRSRARIWETSTPRQSSFGFCHSPTWPVYARRFHARFRSVTAPPLASASVCGSMPNTSSYVSATNCNSAFVPTAILTTRLRWRPVYPTDTLESVTHTPRFSVHVCPSCSPKKTPRTTSAPVVVRKTRGHLPLDRRCNTEIANSNRQRSWRG